MNFSALCTILVTFSSVTPKFTLLTITPFVVILQKLAYHAKYLRISWTYFTGLVVVLVVMIIAIFVW